MAVKKVGRFSFESPFVRQLEEGFPWLRFRPELEPGFVESHFERTRNFVRAALYAGLGLIVLFFVVGYVMGYPTNDWIANLVRFGFLAPAFLAAIIVSHIPGLRQAFRTLVVMTALAIGLGYVVLNATAPDELRQTGFAALPVVIAFIYFALGLFLQTALAIVLAVTVAYVIAALLVGVPADQVAYNLALLIVANFVCGIGSYMLEHALRSAYLEGQILGEMVERDGLTGLYNRSAFDRHLDKVWRMAKRQRKSIAVLMADIDHFKAYNDKHGHQAGDECLKKVAGKVAAAELLRRDGARILLPLPWGDRGVPWTLGVVRDGDRLKGYNTNAIGFMDALNDAGFEVAGKSALVFGTGGAAKAVVFMLNWLRAATIRVAGRNPEKTAAVTERFGVEGCSIDEIVEGPLAVDIVVNATSVSSPQEDPELANRIEKLQLTGCRLVMDLNYGRSQNFWQNMARGQGIQFMDGLPALAFQARRTFALWTKVQVAPAEFLNALQEG